MEAGWAPLITIKQMKVNIHSVTDTLRSVNDETEGSTQKAYMCASWLLPRKVGKMVWIFDEVSFEENDVCFLCASYHVALILTYGYMKKMMCASCVLPTMYH